MAYNTKKGSQHTGDIQFEGDPLETQIDFENDSIKLKTGGVDRLEVNNNHVSASGNISGSQVYANKFYGDGSTLTGVGAMDSFGFGADGGSTQTITNGNTARIAGGTGLTTTAGATDTVTVDLDNTAVTAGDYTYSSFTVDAQGRLTDASSGVAPAITSYNNPGTSRVITSINGTTVNAQANMTFNGTNLDIVGNASASLNISASAFHGREVVIGGPNQSNSPLYVKSEHDNSVVAIFKSPSNDTIMAMSGSGRVVVGGAGAPYLDGKFNISGSDNEKIITLKSNTLNPVFYVEGDGEMWLSGNMTIKGNPNTDDAPFIHFSSSIDNNVKAHIGINNAGNILLQNNTNNKHIVFKATDSSVVKEGLRLDGAVPEVVVNQTPASLVNFRVESENNTHMLYVTGSDQVGIGVTDPAPEVTLDISGSAIRLRNSSTPTNASSPGSQGEIRWDANYIYICISTDTWKRVAIATW